MPYNKTIVFTSPSGAGKTSIARRVLAELPELRFSVSATTREPRAGERDGVQYYFLSEEDFRARIDAGDFLEYEEVYPGLLYGTLKSEVETTRGETPQPVLLDIDVKGAARVENMLDETALTIFILPPSLEELEKRLRSRGTESQKTLAERLSRSRMEMKYADRADVVIVNDHLETAVEEALSHIKSFLKEVTQ